MNMVDDSRTLEAASEALGQDGKRIKYSRVTDFKFFAIPLENIVDFQKQVFG